MKIEQAESDEQIASTFEVMQQLRPGKGCLAS